jgi:hypothetical protein
VVWQSREISQTTVPKLSTENGLIYLYTKRPNAPRNGDAYYFTAIDFATGRTVFRVLTGTGVRYDNNWAAISLAPDGSAYVGVLNGLLRVRDSVSALAGTGSARVDPALARADTGRVDSREREGLASETVVSTIQPGQPGSPEARLVDDQRWVSDVGPRADFAVLSPRR